MDLLLYVVQQLGVMFAVGAQTIILLAYILSVRDGVVDSQEERFAHAIKKVLFFGIVLILVSGAAITALELFAGNQEVVFAPAYVFKACLIGIVAFLSLAIQGDSLPEGLLEGLSGATWYALFIVHILAPVAQWGQLMLLYIVWLIIFMICWSLLMFTMRGKHAAYSDVPKKPAANRASVPAFVRQTPPPAAPVFKPAPVQKTSYQPPQPAKESVPKPTPKPPQTYTAPPLPPPPKAGEVFSLPTIRVMPQSPDNLPR